jgi:hypothetical protein
MENCNGGMVRLSDTVVIGGGELRVESGVSDHFALEAEVGDVVRAWSPVSRSCNSPLHFPLFTYQLAIIN